MDRYIAYNDVGGSRFYLQPNGKMAANKKTARAFKEWETGIYNRKGKRIRLVKYTALFGGNIGCGLQVELLV